MNQSDNIILKRVLNRTKASSLTGVDKLIGFYRTILELERSKEPDIAMFYPYALHFKDDDSNVMLIDLPCNHSLLDAFEKNKDLTFPKDLFIGLPIVRNGKAGHIIAFSATIDYSDLKGFDPYESLLPFRLSRLSLDNRSADELQLTEDKFDEIEAEISKIKNIYDLQDLVKRQFGEDAELKLELQLALSSKNIALAQISSELNKLTSGLAGRNELLSHFISHTSFDNLIENISVDELIPITKLDGSQASVVAHALSNRFSVVTGAPGTGKTQVILNIIANALMRDKTVLVASKNNKAVDNVKERFDVIDPSQYLLRFGKKDYVTAQTIPALARILQRLNALKDQPDNLQSLLSQYKSLIEAVKEAKEKLARIEKLKIELPGLAKQVSDAKEKVEKEDFRHTTCIESIRTRYADESALGNLSHTSLDNKLSAFKRLRNTFQRKYSGISGVWHNLFSKRKHAEILLNFIDELPPSIKTRLREIGVAGSVDDFSNGQAIISQSNLIIPVLEGVCDFLQNIETENRKYSTTISKQKQSLNDCEKRLTVAANEFEDLTGRKGDFYNQINRAKATLDNLGKQLVEAKINSIERQPDASRKISSYKSYLPDNIPWKDVEIPGFIRKTRELLSVCRLISTTSLSVKSAFPLADNLFDMLIIDEASQCDVASALPLILRAKQVVIIGDPQQLRHITSVRIEEENVIREFMGLSDKPYLKYVEQSLWDFSADFLALANQNSSPVTLENHYRCHHDIIGYSNHQFYGRFLDKPLNVKTDESAMTLPQQGIVMINVHGRQEAEHVNINRVEAERCISHAKELCSLKADVSIGIVTPFRDQADYIKANLDDSMKDNVEVNTAHGFQGDEKDVIIYSLVVSENSPKTKINWIDYRVPNLVNVAVTRARQTLYVIGNADYIKAMSPENNALGYLVRYAQTKTK